MKTQTIKTTPEQKINQAPGAKAKDTAQTAPWQSSFKKRMPHRVGEPLSSGGGGDGGGAINF